MLLQFLSLGNRIPACGQSNKSKKFSNDVPKPDKLFDRMYVRLRLEIYHNL